MGTAPHEGNFVKVAAAARVPPNSCCLSDLTNLATLAGLVSLATLAFLSGLISVGGYAKFGPVKLLLPRTLRRSKPIACNCSSWSRAR